MENASKALIIAGAILLSILIIAVGIYVFKKAKSSINTNQLSEVEIEAFNTSFAQYEGTQNGIQVKLLIDKVSISNANNSEAEEKQIKVFYVKKNGNSYSLLSTGPKALSQSAVSVNSGNIKVKFDKEKYFEKTLSSIKEQVVDSHSYKVVMENNDQGFINKIIITY